MLLLNSLWELCEATLREADVVVEVGGQSFYASFGRAVFSIRLDGVLLSICGIVNLPIKAGTPTISCWKLLNVNRFQIVRDHAQSGTGVRITVVVNRKRLGGCSDGSHISHGSLLLTALNCIQQVRNS